MEKFLNAAIFALLLACVSGMSIDTSTSSALSIDADNFINSLPLNSQISALVQGVTSIEPALNVGNSTVATEPLTLINNTYYLFQTSEKLNWYDAAHYCRKKGTNLVSFETPEELRVISDYVLTHNYTYKYFWSSGSDLGTEGDFVWFSNGAPFSGLSTAEWACEQPDNFDNNEDCVNIGLQAGKYVLNDLDCKREINFICEVAHPDMIELTVNYVLEGGSFNHTACLKNAH